MSGGNGNGGGVPIVDDVLGGLNNLFGNTTSEEDSALAQIGDKRGKQYQQAQTTALNDPNIDDVTKNEWRNGIFKYGSLEKDYEAALAGKGDFGIRRRNVQVAKFMMDQPGGSQVNIAVRNRPVGDVPGMPSLIPGADPMSVASLIQDTQKAQEKLRQNRGA